jgi:hypothetical protein
VLSLDLQTEAEDEVVATPMVDAAEEAEEDEAAAAEEEALVNHGQKPSRLDGIKATRLPA